MRRFDEKSERCGRAEGLEDRVGIGIIQVVL
jgi:hypothetical protein